jgi:hypothetical protein
MNQALYAHMNNKRKKKKRNMEQVYRYSTNKCSEFTDSREVGLIEQVLLKNECCR